MKLIALSRSVQPFLKKDYDLNNVFKELVDNSNLKFLGQVLSGPDFIVLTFLAHRLLNGKPVNESIVSKIQNNLFIFNKIDFENENSTIECEDCNGSGDISCDYCDGNGHLRCEECNGNGEVTCPECDGDGESEDEEKCDECNGSGEITCDDCNGDGTVDCPDCYYGNNTCNNCNGRGDIQTSDFIPYTVSIYASFDSNLKNEIEYKIQRFDETESGPMLNCLLVYRRDYNAGEGESEVIDHKFQDKSYFDELIDTDLESEIRYNNRVVIHSLTQPSEKFEE